jgi:hypothetical protein
VPLKEDIAPRDGVRRRADWMFVPSEVDGYSHFYLIYQTVRVELKSVKWSTLTLWTGLINVVTKQHLPRQWELLYSQSHERVNYGHESCGTRRQEWLCWRGTRLMIEWLTDLPRIMTVSILFETRGSTSITEEIQTTGLCSPIVSPQYHCDFTVQREVDD